MDLPATSRTRKELEARLPALVSAWEAEVAETARRHNRRVAGPADRAGTPSAFLGAAV